MKWFFVIGILASTTLIFLLLVHKVNLDVERRIEINKSAAECFKFFADWNNQREFNYFNQAYQELVYESRGAAAYWRFKEGNKDVQAHAYWTTKVEPQRAEFNIDITYGISVPLKGACRFDAVTGGLTRVTCRVHGELAYYQKAILPEFRSDDNTVDPLEDSLMHLKTRLETGR